MAHGDPELYAYKLQETLEAESLLLGRVTYEGFSAAWPERDGVFADKMNAMPKHVVTSTLPELGWNATALTGDVPTAVGELKSGDGGPTLVAGSATGRTATVIGSAEGDARPTWWSSGGRRTAPRSCRWADRGPGGDQAEMVAVSMTKR